MQPFFSVIIPAYNSAEWIRKGLDSIKNQTFTNYEIIIICDDCRDNTADIAQEYTNKVFEVSWHNCGKSRNLGLDKADGEWILFMDDDDWWINNQAFEIIYNKIRPSDKNFNVLVFDFMIGAKRYAKQTPEHMYYATWNKAWKRTFVAEVRFPELPYGDDVQFQEYAVKNAKFEFLNQALYYYNYPRLGSITDQIEKGILPPLK